MPARLLRLLPRGCSAMRRLAAARDGVAVVEFAYSLPFLVLLGMGGSELANFVTTKMRVSQLALHVADNGSRVGTGTVLSVKQITEAQINDLLTGAGLQARELNLYNNGRVIVSSLQADPSNSGKYMIKWQRCRGMKNVTSSYGLQGASNLTGITANGQLITPPTDGAVIFVELAYSYQPLIARSFAPRTEMREIAAMTVRDNRDLTQIYNPEAVTAANCSTFGT
jgi:Flp pilus assembly protein TadG